MKGSKKQSLFIFIPLILVIYPIPLIANTSVSDTSTSKTISQNDLKKKSDLFGLSDIEYRKYLNIMEGPLKHWNENIDPVMALGIFSDNEADKKRYAELYARHEHELVTRTLRFERRYRAAYRKLYPDAEVINPNLMLPYYEYQAKKKVENFMDDKSKLVSGDRIIYFVELDCMICQDNIARLQSIIQKNKDVGLDVYIVGASDEQQARRWAKDNGVNVALVENASVTINLDQGAYSQINQASSETSYYYLMRNGNIFSVFESDILKQ